MKHLIFLACLLFSLQATAQSTTAAQQTLDPALLREDFTQLYQQLQLNHPKLFAYQSKEASDALFAQTFSNITQPMEKMAFQRLIAPFVSSFKDGHTFLDIDFEDEAFTSYVQSGGTFFPLEVTILDNKLYCKSNPFAIGTIQRGDEILSINQEPVQTLLPALRALMSADGEANANANVQRLFGYLLWLHGQKGASSNLQYRKGKKLHQEQLQGISMEELMSLLFRSRIKKRQLHLFPEHSLAVVEINAYGQVKASEAFIDSCFQLIKQHGINNVALDLRKNGGGSSVIGDYFLAHVTRSPYNTTSSKSWRMGPLVQQLDSNHWVTRAIARARPTYRQEGEYLRSPMFDPITSTSIRDTTLFRPARLFLFTSANTYSSAHMTALSVKCGELGTIIGQPTGERLDLTGETIDYQLPHSKISIVIPVASYTTACGDGNQVGVAPDVLILSTAEDLRQGRDPELAYLLNLLSQQN